VTVEDRWLTLQGRGTFIEYDADLVNVGEALPDESFNRFESSVALRMKCVENIHKVAGVRRERPLRD